MIHSCFAVELVVELSRVVGSLANGEQSLLAVDPIAHVGLGAGLGQGGDGVAATQPFLDLFDVVMRAASSAVRMIGEHTV